MPVGWISLRVGDRSPRVGEVGYSLVMEARSQGYASEALQAVVDAVAMVAPWASSTIWA